jgi:hypothetical protein
MRFLMTVQFCRDKFNAAVRDGSVGPKISKILDAIKPEAVYFTEENGRRTALIVVDVPEASRIPALAEPWFLTFDAEIRLRVLMTADDLKRAGLEEQGRKWG